MIPGTSSLARLAGSIAPGRPRHRVAKILTGRHGEQLGTWITAVDAADLISKVTDAVNEELAAWRNWPLDRICPV